MNAIASGNYMAEDETTTLTTSNEDNYEEQEEETCQPGILPPGSERFYKHFPSIYKFQLRGNPEKLISKPEALLGLCDLLYKLRNDRDVKNIRNKDKNLAPLFLKKSKFPSRVQALRYNPRVIKDIVGIVLDEFAPEEWET